MSQSRPSTADKRKTFRKLHESGCFVIHLDEKDERETPASGRYELAAGERFLLQSAGGGGFGDAHRRDRAALQRDIAEGYVSPEAAAREYGAE